MHRPVVCKEPVAKLVSHGSRKLPGRGGRWGGVVERRQGHASMGTESCSDMIGDESCSRIHGPYTRTPQTVGKSSAMIPKATHACFERNSL